MKEPYVFDFSDAGCTVTLTVASTENGWMVTVGLVHAPTSTTVSFSRGGFKHLAHGHTWIAKNIPWGRMGMIFGSVPPSEILSGGLRTLRKHHACVLNAFTDVCSTLDPSSDHGVLLFRVIDPAISDALDEDMREAFEAAEDGNYGIR